jgi:hypothetical protein
MKRPGIKRQDTSVSQMRGPHFALYKIERSDKKYILSPPSGGLSLKIDLRTFSLHYISYRHEAARLQKKNAPAPENHR